MRVLAQFIVVLAIAGSISSQDSYGRSSYGQQFQQPIRMPVKQEQPQQYGQQQQLFAPQQQLPMQYGQQLQQPQQIVQHHQQILQQQQPSSYGSQQSYGSSYGSSQQVPFLKAVLTGCASNPCLNEGVCSEDSTGKYVCKCPWGFIGVNCETCITECSTNPCPSNKKCKAKYGGGYECICPSDRLGPNCEIQNDLCATTQCLNGGVCKLLEGGQPSCICSKPWDGKNCEKVWTNPCTEEVLRSSEALNFKDPWDKHSFIVCVDVEVYHNMPCSTGTYFNENLKHCVPEGYNPPVCSANFCMNDAECIVDEANLLKCVCKKGFSGEKCEVNIDECLLGGNQACMGGTCVDQINGYYCLCGGNRIGLNCQQTIAQPCTQENIELGKQFFELPCIEANTYLQCVGEYNFVVSKCADGLFWHHEQKTCTIEKPLAKSGICATFPCKNGGECVDLGSDFKCQCKSGYTGVTCEQMIDYCLSNPCMNNGRCLSYAGGYTCVCPDRIIDECCCHGIINPCPPKSKILPGINNYYPHLFPHRYIHCDFDGRAFVRNCAPGTRWNQGVLTCLSENFVLNNTEVEIVKPVSSLPMQSAYGGIAQAPIVKQSAPQQSYGGYSTEIVKKPVAQQPTYGGYSTEIKTPIKTAPSYSFETTTVETTTPLLRLQQQPSYGGYSTEIKTPIKTAPSYSFETTTVATTTPLLRLQQQPASYGGYQQQEAPLRFEPETTTTTEASYGQSYSSAPIQNQPAYGGNLLQQTLMNSGSRSLNQQSVNQQTTFSPEQIRQMIMSGVKLPEQILRQLSSEQLMSILSMPPSTTPSVFSNMMQSNEAARMLANRRFFNGY